LRYSIDTSAILQGWLRYYPPDVFPAVWDRLDHLITDGHLSATEEVLHELERQHDDVYQWASRRHQMFIPLDEPIQLAVTSILASHPRLLDNRRNRSGADPFVIALAQLNGATVVTGESPTGNPDKPNIPDVCDALRVPWIGLLQMIRREGWSFPR